MTDRSTGSDRMGFTEGEVQRILAPYRAFGDRLHHWAHLAMDPRVPAPGPDHP